MITADSTDDMFISTEPAKKNQNHCVTSTKNW